LNHAFTYLRPYTDDTSVAIYADWSNCTFNKVWLLKQTLHWTQEFQEFITEYNRQKYLSVYGQYTHIYTFIIHKYKDISTNQRPSL